MFAIEVRINTSLSLLHLSFANFKGYTFSEDNYNGFRQISKRSNEITVFIQDALYYILRLVLITLLVNFYVN